jgi:hypothetical protein
MGGFALALPLLEIMGERQARAQSMPLRYLVSYGGTSLGRNGGGHVLLPSTVGEGYALNSALRYVGDGAAYGVSGFDIQDYVSVISGLRVPWDTGSGVPPGGRIANFHGTGVVPQISGTRSLRVGDPPLGPTSDCIVSDAISGDTTPLHYRVQPRGYNGSNSADSSSGRISYKSEAGLIVAVDPVRSPRAAYESLFGNFVPTDPVEAEKAKRLLRRRQSAIDLVKGSLERLLPQLGSWDRQRMDRHLTEVRELEKRLDALVTPTGRCVLLPDPGPDPEEGEALTGDGQEYSIAAGYSGEEERAIVMADLLHMAFVCDLSRVASWQLTFHKCWMNMFAIAGLQSDAHELSHGAGSPEGLTEVVAWHVKHFARLADKLRNTPEGDGNVLDSTAMVMLFEGGFGADPQGVQGQDSPHSTENMCALVAGRAGGFNTPSRHLVANGAHPAQVLLSAMNAVGVQGPLGDITSAI